MPLKILIFSLFLFCRSVFAQEAVPVGTWQTHIAYHKAFMVRELNDQILCIVENGAFIFDPEDGNISKLTRLDGLNDVGISAVFYDPSDDLMVFGYTNGNIDLIQDHVITNNQNIRESDIKYSKTILDIERAEEFIYLVTEFGVIVYDFPRQSIREIWRDLGSNGEHLRILGSAILEDSIFLATDGGIVSGSLDPAVNLLDYRNWRRYGLENGLMDGSVTLIEEFNGELYFVKGDSILYRYSKGSASPMDFLFNESIVSMQSSEEFLSITLSNVVAVLDDSENLNFIEHEYMKEPMGSLYTANSLWIADHLNGLIRIQNSGAEVIFPNGPFYNNTKNLVSFQDYLLTFPPAFSNSYQPLRNADGFSVYFEGKWINYNNSQGQRTEEIPAITDLTDASFSASGESVYLASFGYGLIHWDKELSFNVLDESTLVNSNPPGNNILVSSVDTDADGTIWVSNYNVDVPLHSYTPLGTWTGITIPFSASRYILDLMVLQNGDKWMIINPAFGGGILVFNEENLSFRLLTAEDNSGGLPDNTIHDMVLDRKGQVWVATDKGVAYFPFPSDVLTEDFTDAILPIYNQNFLFRNEIVTAISVDGGNRKWFGTKTGAWLFDEDGIFLIDNYNTDNSPLLSDQIIDISINQQTGDIFFATDKGINSVRGLAIEPETSHSEVRMYPNPVMPGFNGYLSIDGLPEDAVVKITDVEGKLVYQTLSNGGRATWNLQNNYGNRPATGIYLVFSSTRNGEDTLVGKLSIIK